MLATVSQYIGIVSDSEGFTRTLGIIDALRDAEGCPVCISGNRSAVFKIRLRGRWMMLKCYTCPKPNLRRIYGDKCLHDELFVPSEFGGGEWVDVVVDEWIEGRTLRRAVAESSGDAEAVRRLSREFDRFALELLRSEWAHGDLKPDNIIVDNEGRMHAVDFDAVYRPDLADAGSDETGTAAFQHPLRTAELYGKSIDDYPAALISSALHALSVDSTLHLRFDTDSVLLFDPRAIARGECRALREVLNLFARKCMGTEYRIAMLLMSAVPQLADLRPLLGYMADGNTLRDGDAEPELAVEGGLWGYRSGGRFVIPPVFDCGFEFSEGLAAVRLGDVFHFIDPSGRAVITLGECDAVKPFVDGRAAVVRRGVRCDILRNGVPIYPPPTDFTESQGDVKTYIYE